MDVSYKMLDKHLKHAVWVIHIWALRWISKGWSGSHTSVWWPPKACISAQGGRTFLSSPSATPQCTDVSSGTVSWSKELTQGWNNQQIRESGEKKQLRRSMEREEAKQLGESSFLWQEFTVFGSTYLTTALHAIPDTLKGHRCNTPSNRRCPNLHNALKYQKE